MGKSDSQSITLRVGVTGHRKEIDVEFTATQAAIVLEAIAGAAQAAGGLPVRLQIVSALADGADRIVAREALKLGYELIAVSPGPLDEYAATMTEPDKAAADSEFQSMWKQAAESTVLKGDLSEEKARRDAYARAGHWVLDHCEILIAVLDLNHDNKPAGSAAIAAAALDWGNVLVLIEPSQGKGPHLIQELSGGEFAAVLDKPVGARILPDSCLAPLDDLKNWVVQFIEGESDPCRRDLEREIEYRETRPVRWLLATIGREIWRKPWKWIWQSQPPTGKAEHKSPPAPHGSFKGMLRHCREDFACLRNWARQYYAPAARPNRTPDFKIDAKYASGRITAEYDKERKVPRQLAALYKDLYLSSFIIMIALGLVAVYFGLKVLSLENAGHHYVILELSTICLILLIYSAGHFFRWQHRMVDYRLLAEWLRHATPLALLGVRPPRFEMPQPYARHDPARTWVRTYFRELVCRIRYDVADSPNWGDPVEKALVKQYILQSWIGAQINYHIANRNRAASLHGALNAMCLVFAAAALLCCGLDLLFPGVHSLGILSAMLPAMLGACHSVAGQAELRRLIDRSEAMVLHLEHAQRKVERLWTETADEPPIGRWAQQTAKLMFEEVNEWRAVFVLRPTDLHI